MAVQDDDAEQEREWDLLYARLGEIMRRYGKEDWLGHADYWIVSDNWGPRQHTIYIHNLKMLAADVVEQLQANLKDFPNWEIVVDVSPEQYGQSWPTMGLTIRAHEIIDDLKREYFPTEFQRIKYEGSRRGDA
jgi:hypothetical protein